MTHHARPAHQTGRAAPRLQAVEALGISLVEVGQASPISFGQPKKYCYKVVYCKYTKKLLLKKIGRDER